MRRAFIAANWKMHKRVAEATAFASDLLPRIEAGGEVDIAVAPPFTALAELGKALAGSRVALAAQNVHDMAGGAFTGEIAAEMLVELGCRYAIVGHSERRQFFDETDSFIARKARSLLDAGIVPIVCVGETVQQREAGETESVVEAQLRESLATVQASESATLVVAYEPVWAIGTGRGATPEMAQAVHAFTRAVLHDLFGTAADAIRIQYGGSVKPDNAGELLAQADIDGALVGGASLEAGSFAAIIQAAAATASR
jgi:triosephosphate isomerase